jgi:hypothetical protein
MHEKRLSTSLAELLEARKTNLADWLRDTAPECTKEQRHLNAGTNERVYWHYGYLMAVKDVLALLGNTGTPHH